MLLFVYGTLKKDCINHNVILNAQGEYICNAKTTVRYPMYVDMFPVIEDVQGIGNTISGELYNVSDYFKCVLDDFEGVPDLCKCGIIEVQTDKGVFVAEAYFRHEESSEEELKQMIENKKLISEYKE